MSLVKADVIVLGAGIVGVAAALHLQAKCVPMPDVWTSDLLLLARDLLLVEPKWVRQLLVLLLLRC